MDFVEYQNKKLVMFNDLGRACRLCGGVSCEECPFSVANNGKNLECDVLELICPEKAVEIIEKWAKEHPVKTFLSDFLKKHPSAPLTDAKVPRCCPYYLGYVQSSECIYDCFNCWNRPLKED